MFLLFFYLRLFDMKLFHHSFDQRVNRRAHMNDIQDISFFREQVNNISLFGGSLFARIDLFSRIHSGSYGDPQKLQLVGGRLVLDRGDHITGDLPEDQGDDSNKNLSQINLHDVPPLAVLYFGFIVILFILVLDIQSGLLIMKIPKRNLF